MLRTFLLMIATAVAMATTSHAATFVDPNSSGTTDLGDFAAGQYTLTATGLVSLVGPVGSGFDIRPDGVPNTPVLGPYGPSFNPNGTDRADGRYGPGGAGLKLGALIGSFVPVANLGNGYAVGSHYFLIGPSLVLNHTGGHIYATVNDVFYGNNAGGFTVTVTENVSTGVPEPATWALMLTGFIGAGAALRSHRRRPTPQLR